jgi:hypothetical protein
MPEPRSSELPQATPTRAKPRFTDVSRSTTRGMEGQVAKGRTGGVRSMVTCTTILEDLEEPKRQRPVRLFSVSQSSRASNRCERKGPEGRRIGPRRGTTVPADRASRQMPSIRSTRGPMLSTFIENQTREEMSSRCQRPQASCQLGLVDLDDRPGAPKSTHSRCSTGLAADSQQRASQNRRNRRKKQQEKGRVTERITTRPTSAEGPPLDLARLRCWSFPIAGHR